MKNKNLMKLVCTGVAFLFSALVFATMAGAGQSLKVGSTTLSVSVYDLLSDGNGVVVTAFIFTIVEVLGALAVCAFDFFKVKFNYTHFCAAFFGLLALTAGILFFCSASGSGANLGAGAVFSGIFSIFAFFGFCGYTFFAFKK